jgi:dTDP-4-dehydrorhamnose 3,5-epimerase
MIDGVVLKELIRHPDERGYFEEMIRKTDDFFSEGFAQVSHSFMLEGVVKAWHIHKSQLDWWYVAGGTVKAVVYDARKESKTYKETNEFILGNPNGPNVVLKIPFGVAHGLKVVKGPADLVYVTSGIYSKEEEGRIAYDDPDIGYDWVQGVPITNKNIT